MEYSEFKTVNVCNAATLSSSPNHCFTSAHDFTFTLHFFSFASNSPLSSNATIVPSKTQQQQAQEHASPPLSPRNRDAQSLLPLTVKQIYDALQTNDDKANLIVDGVDVNNEGYATKPNELLMLRLCLMMVLED
ncbi:hypothetical protein LR48_Vigan09g192900 [Vigna angularis]|uniref:Uncharacterized protein n=1 Tax=Phaseolus angularis TaxID=3914 RepID=A0A0L9VDY6_PHAAN|nr:hypothetical protein LR48_Vigan09g192900 [Vigna angularis]